MLATIREMKLSTRLLVLPAVFAVAFTIFAAFSHATLSEAKVHGPYYTELALQTALSYEAAPSLLSMRRPCLAALQLAVANTPQDRARWSQDITAFTQEYDQKVAYWQGQRISDTARASLDASERLGREFLRTLSEEYVPAVLAGDAARADRVLHERVLVLYDRQLDAIRTLTQTAQRASAQAEDDVRTVIDDASRRELWLCMFLLGAIVAFALWLRSAALAGAAREEETRERLHATMESIAHCGRALGSSAANLNAISENLMGLAETTSSRSQGVSASSDQISTTLQTVASGAEQYSASIQEIARNAHEATHVASEAVNAAANANAKVAKLGASSQEIGAVVKVISSIAQQTNLLALNATIESARAGEAGKGFAVVANEVKELAKATSAATKDIGAKIEAIQTDTRSAVDALAEIARVITRINEHQHTIASAVEEQTSTTNEISRSVNEGARGSGEIASAIAGVAQAARDTKEGSARARAAAAQLLEMGRELEELVAGGSAYEREVRVEARPPRAGRRVEARTGQRAPRGLATFAPGALHRMDGAAEDDVAAAAEE